MGLIVNIGVYIYKYAIYPFNSYTYSSHNTIVSSPLNFETTHLSMPSLYWPDLKVLRRKNALPPVFVRPRLAQESPPPTQSDIPSQLTYTDTGFSVWEVRALINAKAAHEARFSPKGLVAAPPFSD